MLYFFKIGCVLYYSHPMDLNSKTVLIAHGPIYNQIVLRCPPGVQAHQGNNQEHLKSLEGRKADHENASSETLMLF